jgi:hypothetical protein
MIIGDGVISSEVRGRDVRITKTKQGVPSLAMKPECCDRCWSNGLDCKKSCLEDIGGDESSP